jgi:predicted GNAT family N-acyltransferase
MMYEKLNPLNCKVERLTAESNITAFDCGDDDLNNFLLEDAKNYLTDLFAVTYLIQTDSKVLAYFSLSNDRITRMDMDKSEWNRLSRNIANNKRKRSYPSVKLGRLAVEKESAQLGFGRMILYYIRETYANELQKAGCRFITVDAYANVTDFYERNGFKFMTQEDADRETRAMYFDLKSI